jgi:hypothetical protein
MNQERAISLLDRQLSDLQAQAEKILRGNDSAQAIEAFSKYSSEMKIFILENVASEKLVDAAKAIPQIDYSRAQVSWWEYLIAPYWWVSVYKDYGARQQCRQDISHVRGKYASLQMMLRGLV